MKRSIVPFLACPACGGSLDDPAIEAAVVAEGSLTCRDCRHRYPIVQGVPVLLTSASTTEARTANLYSDLWMRFTPIWRRGGRRSSGYSAPARSHFELLCKAAGRDVVEGEAGIDAGCGNATSLFEAASVHPEVAMIGVDLSTGPRTASEAADETSNIHLVQGDLLEIPLARERFDFVMSFGVLHHTPAPERAFGNLVERLRPGGLITVFVYKDFSDIPIKRALLWPVKAVRRLTTRLPPRVIRGLAWAGAPFVFLALTVPGRVLSRMGAVDFARHIPYATFPDVTAIAGSLEDRFGVPHEHRFSRDDLENWVRRVGLESATVVDCFPFGFSGLVLSGRKGKKAVGTRPFADKMVGNQRAADTTVGDLWEGR